MAVHTVSYSEHFQCIRNTGYFKGAANFGTFDRVKTDGREGDGLPDILSAVFMPSKSLCAGFFPSCSQRVKMQNTLSMSLFFIYCRMSKWTYFKINFF